MERMALKNKSRFSCIKTPRGQTKAWIKGGRIQKGHSRLREWFIHQRKDFERKQAKIHEREEETKRKTECQIVSNCEDEIFVNHVLMIAKQYLYSCRCKNKSPLIKVFNARIRKIEFLELEVAKSKNKLPDYTAKWGKFLKNIDL